MATSLPQPPSASPPSSSSLLLHHNDGDDDEWDCDDRNAHVHDHELAQWPRFHRYDNNQAVLITPHDAMSRVLLDSAKSLRPHAKPAFTVEAVSFSAQGCYTAMAHMNPQSMMWMSPSASSEDTPNNNKVSERKREEPYRHPLSREVNDDLKRRPVSGSVDGIHSLTKQPLIQTYDYMSSGATRVADITPNATETPLPKPLLDVQAVHFRRIGARATVTFQQALRSYLSSLQCLESQPEGGGGGTPISLIVVHVNHDARPCESNNNTVRLPMMRGVLGDPELSLFERKVITTRGYRGGAARKAGSIIAEASYDIHDEGDELAEGTLCAITLHMVENTFRVLAGHACEYLEVFGSLGLDRVSLPSTTRQPSRPSSTMVGENINVGIDQHPTWRPTKFVVIFDEQTYDVQPPSTSVDVRTVIAALLTKVHTSVIAPKLELVHLNLHRKLVALTARARLLAQGGSVCHGAPRTNSSSRYNGETRCMCTACSRMIYAPRFMTNSGTTICRVESTYPSAISTATHAFAYAWNPDVALYTHITNINDVVRGSRTTHAAFFIGAFAAVNPLMPDDKLRMSGPRQQQRRPEGAIEPWRVKYDDTQEIPPEAFATHEDPARWIDSVRMRYTIAAPETNQPHVEGCIGPTPREDVDDLYRIIHTAYAKSPMRTGPSDCNAVNNEHNFIPLPESAMRLAMTFRPSVPLSSFILRDATTTSNNMTPHGHAIPLIVELKARCACQVPMVEYHIKPILANATTTTTAADGGGGGPRRIETHSLATHQVHRGELDIIEMPPNVAGLVSLAAVLRLSPDAIMIDGTTRSGMCMPRGWFETGSLSSCARDWYGSVRGGSGGGGNNGRGGGVDEEEDHEGVGGGGQRATRACIGTTLPIRRRRTSSNNSDVTSYCFYQLVRNEFVTFTTGR